MTSSPTNPPVSVCLTFDHLGSALDIRLDRASRPDPQRIDLVDGFPRLLDLLDDIAAPGTFYCEGWSALHHPEAVQALLARGHEIGLHGWVHERWTELTRPERERVLHDSVAAMRRAGVEQPGFRAPGGLLVGDVDGDGGDDALLEQVGITEDSSIRPGGAEHAPTIVGTTGLVNVPFVWPAVDFWCYELNPDDPATTDDLPDRWWALLEAARRRPDRLLVLDMHPGCSGTPEARFRAVEKVIRRYAAEPDVQFRTVGSVAAQVRRA
ncbi:MAG: polysaccharide deacetylase family protein, partial [Actinobacteria bacterium]|nr:polysaccharide deacetylase family protein [Actinomycetota bacterium]